MKTIINSRTRQYRVWDTFKKRMCYNEVCMYASFNDNGSVNLYNGICDNVLMESSGLTAVNALEIYEGDIVMDTLTKGVYEVRLGFCKKHAFTGWYLSFMEDDSIQRALNADEDSVNNSAKYLRVIGDIYSKDFKSLLV